MRTRFSTLGAVALALLMFSPSRPLESQDHGDDHGHADDATIGFTVCVDAGNRLGVEFDGDEVFELPEVDGVLVGWVGDEPGFNTLEADEPDEGSGALLVLELPTKGTDPA